MRIKQANLKMLIISHEEKGRKDMNGGQYRESLTVQFYFLSKKLSEANTAKCYYLLSVNCRYVVHYSLYFSVWLAFYNF